jgi:type II secretory pathway component PulK
MSRLSNMRVRRRVRSQRGTILVVALVCLLVIMTLVGQMLLSVVRTGRQWKVERDARQCELLLQAGMNRALEQLSKNADYRGSTHELPAEQIIAQGAGRVVIEVTRPGENQVELRVQAEYPLGSEHSVRRSRVLSLQQANSTSTEE